MYHFCIQSVLNVWCVFKGGGGLHEEGGGVQKGRHYIYESSICISAVQVLL